MELTNNISMLVIFNSIFHIFKLVIYLWCCYSLLFRLITYIWYIKFIVKLEIYFDSIVSCLNIRFLVSGIECWFYYFAIDEEKICIRNKKSFLSQFVHYYIRWAMTRTAFYLSDDDHPLIKWLTSFSQQKAHIKKVWKFFLFSTSLDFIHYLSHVQQSELTRILIRKTLWPKSFYLTFHSNIIFLIKKSKVANNYTIRTDMEVDNLEYIIFNYFTRRKFSSYHHIFYILHILQVLPSATLLNLCTPWLEIMRHDLGV